jgi:hypothetical protein
MLTYQVMLMSDVYQGEMCNIVKKRFGLGGSVTGKFGT